TAQIYCQLLHTCHELGDYRRAREWAQAAEDCFEHTGLASWPGDRETHRTAILINSGAWTLAEQLVHRACAAGAHKACAKAEELATSPPPSRARLKLLRGHPVEAAAPINAARRPRGPVGSHPAVPR